MLPVFEHRWDLTPQQAIALQKELASRVRTSDLFDSLTSVCGVDVSYDQSSDLFFAVAAVLSFPELEIMEVVGASARSPFPYVPGLLSFREIPVIRQALARLTVEPGLLVCDAQGVAHPRRFGLAAHLGVLYDRPSIGAAKSRLCGEYREPRSVRGAWTWLTLEQERIGQVVRTRDDIAPLFVSPGHRVAFHTARKIVLALCPRYRLPETTRIAHGEVNRLRREINERRG